MQSLSIQTALSKYFGYSEFRPMQESIINTILAKKDCMVLMPTGGGKSICFQIPAIVSEGIAIIISPLISLMKDQVESLKGNGVAAAFLNSTQSVSEQVNIESEARSGNLKLLYVSPEKLMTAGFTNLLENLQISLVAIDEAHCISSWGHDFRKEYTQLKFLKQKLPNTPVVALTATADPITQRDILKQLGLNEPEVFIASFDRPNIRLAVSPGQKKFQQIFSFIERRKGQSGIIYCLSRKDTERLAEKLENVGIKATYYHAGMPAEARAKAQEDFINDRIPIVCATIAFGMGIDKSNVRWVIHHNLPKNIEGYYQEIGRGGRDGLACDTLLFYSYRDVATLRSFAEESGQRELQLAKLERMQQYAEALSCRRKILLSYFGEQLNENCGNCDICDHPPEQFDGTIIAQKALSAVARLKERVGLNLLIDILRGSARQEIIQNGYQHIKTYGAGKDINFRDWQNYLVQLINQGYMHIAFDKKNALQLSESSKKVLFEKKKVNLFNPELIEKRKETKFVKRKSKKEVRFEKLLAELEVLRQQIASEEKLPPYQIFSDASLHDIATKMPVNADTLSEIKGMSELKLEKYGDRFSAHIIDFIAREVENGSKIKGGSQLVTFKQYEQKLSPEEIASKRGLNIFTIYGHLCLLFEDGFDIDLRQYLQEDEVKKIKETIAAFSKSESTTPIYDHLKDDINYHKVKIALTLHQAKQL